MIVLPLIPAKGSLGASGDLAPLAHVGLAILGEGEVRVSITFLGECWTDIRDASGRRLFYDTGYEGQTVNVSGEAPLSVLFGVADNVSMTVNGRDFAIADADRRGRTARFMLHGS